MISSCWPGLAKSDEELSEIRVSKEFLENHCVDCHYSGNSDQRLDIESLADRLDKHLERDFNHRPLEQVIRRLQSRQMPPPDVKRPDDLEIAQAIERLGKLARSRWERYPRIGKTATFRRLTRTEYRNAIRDLLGLEVDVDQWLPKDESSQGFDNITVDSLSPTLLTRYVTAAEKISRMAVGSAHGLQISKAVRIPADRSQEKHVAGLPFGTRGGTQFSFHFPQSGDYEIQIKLTRDRDEKVEGLNAVHRLDLLLDRKRIHRFTIKPPAGSGTWRDYTHVDSHLRKKISVAEGAHTVGVTFPQGSAALEVTKRQPFDTNFNRHRHPRKTPAIFQVTIVGPIESQRVPADQRNSITRQRIFTDYPAGPEDELTAAKAILRNLMQRAYRRKVTEADFTIPLQLYENARAENGFEQGIELAVASILVNPNFLFRVETPNREANEKITRLSDTEIASRLSFFLWSSLPDKELLELALNDKLSEKEVLVQQVRRMLNDRRATSFVDNFLTQWLHLKNLDSITPNLRLFPDFDDNLRQSFKGETKLLFADVMRENRSVLELIRPDYTYLNERLALHYGISGVKGSHFRKVKLAADSRRGGVLRHGSILTVTSYATRTSPTIRGNWILKNIVGTPPPPPPANVPNLREKSFENFTSVRERLKAHRADSACAGCHRLMDPIGFSLENYDAVGRWREYDDTIPIDTVGVYPDGTRIENVKDVEQAILKHPDAFVQTFVEKLLTYALGRGMTPGDGPLIREIVAESRKENFRFKSILSNIVQSPLFLMRTVE